MVLTPGPVITLNCNTPTTIKELKETSDFRRKSVDCRALTPNENSQNIPVLKISLAGRNSSRASNKTCSTPKTSKNQNVLNVPNGNSRGRKPISNQNSTAFDTQLKNNNIGSATVVVGTKPPVEVAKNANMVTCTTCFPLFQRFSLKQN